MKYIGEKKAGSLVNDWRALPSDALADENPIHSELQPSAQNRREAPPGTVLDGTHLVAGVTSAAGAPTACGEPPVAGPARL